MNANTNTPTPDPCPHEPAHWFIDSFMVDDAFLGVYVTAVFAALLHFARISDQWSDGLHCDPSIREIAQLINCGKTSVRNALNILEGVGWIEVIRFGSHGRYHARNQYVIHTPQQAARIQRDTMFREQAARTRRWINERRVAALFGQLDQDR